MWIFTEVGYFSIVRADPDPNGIELVMVRARVRRDLEQLVERYISATWPAEILIHEWPGRDYPYRIIISREVWGAILLELGMAVDYPNFKSRISELGQHARAHVYSQIWALMLGLERKTGVALPRNRSVYETSG